MLDRDVFIEWANKHFDNVKTKGHEIKINDIWWEDAYGNKDTKNHCWVNIDKACFRAFKSEKTGNVFSLVMEVEGCTWGEAKELLGADNLKGLEDRVKKFLKNPHSIQIVKEIKNLIDLPEGTYYIKSLISDNPYRIQAERYLKNRKLDIDQLMISTSGQYKNRIIIPYYNQDGDLIYFNGRDISGRSGIKYLGPPKEIGVGKGDVLWMSSYPVAESKIYVTEGEFDAMVLRKCGLHSAACGGKTLSDKQIEILREYHIVMSYDSDEAGKNALNIVTNLMRKGIKNIGYIRSPVDYKDWNELYLKSNEDVICQYIKKYEQSVDSVSFEINKILKG